MVGSAAVVVVAVVVPAVTPPLSPPPRSDGAGVVRQAPGAVSTAGPAISVPAALTVASGRVVVVVSDIGSLRPETGQDGAGCSIGISFIPTQARVDGYQPSAF